MDWHDVDEDLMTMSAQSGYWCDDIGVGIARRSVIDFPFSLSDTVASSNMKNSQIIRMVLMSTKTWCLLASAMGNGTMESGEVSHFEIYMIPLPLQEIMLLRPTSEIDQILYG